MEAVMALGLLLGLATGQAQAEVPYALCGCHERPMPAYARLKDSHRMLACTVVVPKDGLAAPEGCKLWVGGQTGLAVGVASP